MFQSAPRVETRGDVTICLSMRPALCFNPRPASRRGAIVRPYSVCGASEVSIRAPRRDAGRYPAHISQEATEKFQSAPRVETRGDEPCKPKPVLFVCFNPRPASRRGAIQLRPLRVGGNGVSIRAPRRDAGRFQFHRLPSSFCMFQSAPRVETRGDLADLLIDQHVNGFNPRPASRRGAIDYKRDFFCNHHLFQSAPRVETRGDLPRIPIDAAAIRFQSAPRVETRGDPGPHERAAHRLDVSIRAPRRDAGRYHSSNEVSI